MYGPLWCVSTGWQIKIKQFKYISIIFQLDLLCFITITLDQCFHCALVSSDLQNSTNFYTKHLLCTQIICYGAEITLLMWVGLKRDRSLWLVELEWDGLEKWCWNMTVSHRDSPKKKVTLSIKIAQVIVHFCVEMLINKRLDFTLNWCFRRKTNSYSCVLCRGTMTGQEIFLRSIHNPNKLISGKKIQY